LKTCFLTILTFLTTFSIAQTKGNRIFNNLELSFSHSIEFDQSLNSSNARFNQIALEGLPGGRADLGLNNYEQVDQNPVVFNYPFPMMDCMGAGIGVLFTGFAPGHNNFNIEILKTLSAMDNRFSFGLDIGYRRSVGGNTKLRSQPLYFVNYNSMDSLLFSDNDNLLDDTLILVPAVSIANFSMPSTNMMSFGLSAKIRVLGKQNSKWRMYVSASYRRMFNLNKVITSVASQQTYTYSYGYSNNTRLSEKWQDSYYHIEHLNVSENRSKQFEFDGNSLALNSYLIGVNIERQLWSENVNWGLRFQCGGSTYLVNNKRLLNNDIARIGGYLAFMLR